MEGARKKQKRTGKERFVRKLHRELEKSRASLAEESRQKKNWKKQKTELLQIGYEVLFQKADSLSDEVLLGLLGQSSGILENVCQEKQKEMDSR